MQKTVIINAHVISPGVDLRNATIVIEGRKIKGVVQWPEVCEAGQELHRG